MSRFWPFGRKETSDKDVDVLLEQADAASPTGPFRMPVEDVFSITGRGTVATGRVESGRLSVGQAGRRRPRRRGRRARPRSPASRSSARRSRSPPPARTSGCCCATSAKEQVQRGDVIESAG